MLAKCAILHSALKNQLGAAKITARVSWRQVKVSFITPRMAILAALDGFRNPKDIISLTGRWEMSELAVWQRPNDVLQ